MFTSGFYDWTKRQAAPPTMRENAKEALIALIRDVFDAADGNYGVERIYRDPSMGPMHVHRSHRARPWIRAAQ